MVRQPPLDAGRGPHGTPNRSPATTPRGTPDAAAAVPATAAPTELQLAAGAAAGAVERREVLRRLPMKELRARAAAGGVGAAAVRRRSIRSWAHPSSLRPIHARPQCADG